MLTDPERKWLSKAEEEVLEQILPFQSSEGSNTADFDLMLLASRSSRQ